jgi:hypothetical protein
MVILGRLLVVFTCFLSVTILSAQQPDTTFWVPNGPVKSIVLHDTTVILGGEFDQIAPFTGSFVRIDTATASVDQNYFKVNGPVYVMERDTLGRMYVGGSFNRAGNTTVSNLFRLLPDGTFDPSFIYVVDGPVYSLLIDSLLYIGGDFSYINGEPRNNLAAVRLDSGYVSPFDSNVNGPVYCMALDTFFDAIVIGGDFTQVGPYNPPYLAKVERISGFPFHTNAIPWTALPNCDGPVHDMVLLYNRLLFGGEFQNFASTNRPGLARLDIYYGTITPADAQINGFVYDIQMVDTLCYIAGKFNSVLGQPRSNVACIKPMLDSLYGWNPGTNGVVLKMEPVDSLRLFLGGDFSLVGGDTCTRGAIVSRSDSFAVVANWNPKCNDTVFAACRDTFGRLYVGGAFYALGGVERNNLCAVSTVSGMATAWNPNPNDAVNTLTLDGDSLYFAGDFTAVNGVQRGRIAAVDLIGDSLLPFNPGTNGVIRTIAVTDSLVYAGGNFTSFGGAPRNNIGKVSKSTSQPINWNANCLGTVNSILVTPSWIYVAGYFSTIGGQTRENLARVHPALATADLNWICNTDDGIYHAEFYNGSIVLGGWFDIVNGQTSPDFAFVDTTSLQVTVPNCSGDGFVRTFTSYGDDFFMSGSFELINFQYQPRLASYDAGDNAMDPWTPAPDRVAVTMAASATRLYTGGALEFTGGRYHPNFQVLPIQWVTTVHDISVQDTDPRIFPNPTDGNIVVNNVEQYSAYTVTDITGKVVKSGAVNGAFEISLAEYPAGLYFLNLSGDEVIPVSRRIIRG